MNQANHIAGFGTLFPTLAALTGPAHEFVTRTPAYGAPSGLRIRPHLGRYLRALVQAFEHRREQARVRRELARLDDHLLRDIGLSRADVGVELPEPFLGLAEPLAGAHGDRRGVSLGDARVGLWHL